MQKRAGLFCAGLFVLLLIPTWTFVLYEIRHERQTAERSARQNAMNLATAFEAHVRSVIMHADTVLLDMRNDVLDDPHEFQQLVQEEMSVYGGLIAQLSVIDADGFLRFSNLAPTPQAVDLSDRAHFRIHRDNPGVDRLYISKPVLGRVSGLWSIQFTRPILEDGVFRGVVVLSVPPARLANYYQQIDVGTNGSIMLLGEDGGIRALASATLDPSAAYQLTVPPDRPYFAEHTAANGFYRGITVLDGEERLGAYRRLDEYRLAVAVFLAPADFLAAFDEHRALLLQLAGVITALLLALSLSLFGVARVQLRYTEGLREAHRQMEALASTDVLTGTLSRRFFLEALQIEMKRAQRHGESLCLLIMDIDHFKQVNDVFGHPIGDEVLRSFADRCRSVLRAHDLLGRLGGEEFIALLPHTDTDGALHVAEKLRAAVAAAPVASPRGDVAVTVSIGVAALVAGQDCAELTAQADHALYAAKAGGRNRVCLAAPGTAAV